MSNSVVSEISDKNGVIYDIAGKQFDGDRTVALTGDVTGSASWNGAGQLSLATSIAAGAVDTNELADKAATNAKLDDQAVTWDKIANTVKNGSIAGNYTEKLATCAQVKTYVDEQIAGGSHYLGQKTVAEISALTSINNGDLCNCSDSGSVTNPDGTSTTVVAGDNVIYDGTLRKWDRMAGDYKVKQDPVSATGSTTKTLTALAQNDNGVVTPTFENIASATTSSSGIVQLAGSIGSTVSEENNKAATEKAVRDAIDEIETGTTYESEVIAEAIDDLDARLSELEDRDPDTLGDTIADSLDAQVLKVKGQDVEELIGEKTDKVTGATSGNLPKLDSSGNLADSGVGASSVSSAISAASTAVQTVAGTAPITATKSGTTVTVSVSAATDSATGVVQYMTSSEAASLWTNAWAAATA